MELCKIFKKNNDNIYTKPYITNFNKCCNATIKCQNSNRTNNK